MEDLFETFPDAEAAYLEAVNHCHDLTNWEPSHDVIFETGRRVTWGKLRRSDTGAGKRAFIKIYKDVCKAYVRGERFRAFKPEVREVPRIARLRPEERAANSNRIAEIKAVLGGEHA